jgi:[FeFe] hydrogenase H-cluster maturation GTPase HydF
MHVRRSGRLHIGIFGRRNVGKSSLLNQLCRQEVSIVSPDAGTTTDPVEKPMELQPIGPVIFIDTAGVDDVGALGEKRITRTRQVINRVDVGLIVCDAPVWTAYEHGLFAELARRDIPVVAVFSKADLNQPTASECSRLEALSCPVISLHTFRRVLEEILSLKHAIHQATQGRKAAPAPLLLDLVAPGELVLMVVPVDSGAPVGRLILPQQQVLREVIDNGRMALVCREHELQQLLESLKNPPALVVTDSQAFEYVSRIVPDSVPLTGFSVLFARRQGDLAALHAGAKKIMDLSPGDRVLIAEACSHHPGSDDIGRVKLPRWLNERLGPELVIEHCQGHDFPENLASYDLVIHCGACMWNRREMISRIMLCEEAGVPITNYGLCIAQLKGILARAVKPFQNELARSALSFPDYSETVEQRP